MGSRVLDFGFIAVFGALEGSIRYSRSTMTTSFCPGPGREIYTPVCAETQEMGGAGQLFGFELQFVSGGLMSPRSRGLRQALNPKPTCPFPSLGVMRTGIFFLRFLWPGQLAIVSLAMDIVLI